LDSELGLVVGLAAEARVARPLGWPIAIGGGTYAGALLAAERLVRSGVKALVSFGVAGGLDPALRPGTVLVPQMVLTDGRHVPTDPALNQRLGRQSEVILLGADRIVASAAAKTALFTATRAGAVDIESGAVALVASRHGIPFAVLRAICDPAERDLPPAALIAPNRRGGIRLARIIGSVLKQPAQLPYLPMLAADAAAAHRALRAAIIAVGRASAAWSAVAVVD
jgi:adenosylhomocysteine nucleosidase